jgi:hypothetical protein
MNFKFAFALFAFIALFNGSQSTAIAGSPMFSFEYQSSDGQVHMNCEHTALANDSWDWRVVCGKRTRNERNFGVHLVIRRLTSATVPQLTVEILYFVADRRSSTESRYTSNVTTMKFKQLTDFHSIRLAQSVDNDYAHLWLNLGEF